MPEVRTIHQLNAAQHYWRPRIPPPDPLNEKIALRAEFREVERASDWLCRCRDRGGVTCVALEQLDEARSDFGYMRAAYAIAHEWVGTGRKVLGADPARECVEAPEWVTVDNAPVQLPYHIARAVIFPTFNPAFPTPGDIDERLSDELRMAIHTDHIRMVSEYRHVRSAFRDALTDLPPYPGTMTPERRAEVLAERQVRLNGAMRLIEEMTADPKREAELGAVSVLDLAEPIDDKFARHMALWAMPYWRQASCYPDDRDIRAAAWRDACWAMQTGSRDLSRVLSAADLLNVRAKRGPLSRYEEERVADPLQKRNRRQLAGSSRH